MDANFAIGPINRQLELDQGVTVFYVDANFAIVPFDWQLELDQGVTEFYVDTNFAIGPIDWQLDLGQGVTEFYVDANFVIGPIDWQLELDQGITEFSVDTNFAIGPINWQLELDQGITEFVDANFDSRPIDRPPVFHDVGRISWRKYCLPTSLITRSVEGTTAWVLTPKIIPVSISKIIVLLLSRGLNHHPCST